MPDTTIATTMRCPNCEGQLSIRRSCGRVRMSCGDCQRQYRIHEVADRLDEQAEEVLSRWTSIIYD
ncbi:MAG: dual CXXC motif small (seleno)protein [Desulfurivibrio sp.]|nr:dual CXXC motif small (seleno)protein [Desulfurivibrio sp.]